MKEDKNIKGNKVKHTEYSNNSNSYSLKRKLKEIETFKRLLKKTEDMHTRIAEAMAKDYIELNKGTLQYNDDES